MAQTSIWLLLASAFAAAAGQLLFKIGATGRDTLVAFINPAIVSGAVLYLGASAIWVYVLSKEKLVGVYAFTALTFVLVYVAGVFLLGERLTLPAMAGVGCVLVGLFLISSYST